MIIQTWSRPLCGVREFIYMNEWMSDGMRNEGENKSSLSSLIPIYPQQYGMLRLMNMKCEEIIIIFFSGVFFCQWKEKFPIFHSEKRTEKLFKPHEAWEMICVVKIVYITLCSIYNTHLYTYSCQHISSLLSHQEENNDDDDDGERRSIFACNENETKRESYFSNCHTHTRVCRLEVFPSIFIVNIHVCWWHIYTHKNSFLYMPRPRHKWDEFFLLSTPWARKKYCLCSLLGCCFCFCCRASLRLISIIAVVVVK